MDHGITTTMGRRTALALCDLAGLSPDERGRYGGRYWALDEAVSIALLKIAKTEPAGIALDGES